MAKAQDVSKRKNIALTTTDNKQNKSAVPVIQPITLETLFEAKQKPALGITSLPNKETCLDDTRLYINRELSLLQFNYRVLAQAIDPQVPLLERLKFLAICCSNLDEFFEIRVAGIHKRVAYDNFISGPDGLSSRELLNKISQMAHHVVTQQYRILNEQLIPSLETEKIFFIDQNSWTKEQASWVESYFHREVFPVLNPIGLDLAHPFPRLLNKSLNFIFALKGKDAFGRDSGLAVMQAPRSLPRIIRLPKSEQPGDHFILLSSIIQAHAEKLFPGMKVKGCYQFRLTRNSDLSVEETADDLAHALQGELFSRRFGDAVRLEVTQRCPDEIIQFLLRKFELTETELYKVNGPVNLSRLMGAYVALEHPHMQYPAHKYTQQPTALQSSDIFETIRKDDILLHHPYQSFGLVVDFVQQAAVDPNVLAIRQTLYRTGVHSKLVRALIDAAKAGKEVTAVIELRARFDEQENIHLAKSLQEAGVLVVYGVVDYKTHAKMSLVVRREGQALTRYVHLGTGNYHSTNAKYYTDFGLLTCDQSIGEDVHNVFQQLTGMGKVFQLNKLLQSPFTLHSKLVEFINNEIANANAGKDAHIIIKINALAEKKLIKKLYEASQAGVKVDLIVRGICCLKPGIEGISENITVRSIVGRFLEHTRVYYFKNDGQPKVYCSSADWLVRNMFHRIEVCFPIDNSKLAKRVIEEGLMVYLKDNTNAWQLESSGDYVKLTPAENKRFCAQENLAS